MNATFYNHLYSYLTEAQLPEDFTMIQKNQLQKQAARFQILHNLLYKRNNNQPIRVIRRAELEPLLYMFHVDPTAAHASERKMMEKLKTRYYWPQMFEDIRTYVKTCDICQRRGKGRRTEPLHPIPVYAPFHRIGIDFVGPLPRSTTGNRYIIVAMDYLTKWPEAKPVPEATAEATVQFIYETIICRHGCPSNILSDRGTHFNNRLLQGLVQKFQIKHHMSTPYHPQTNGLVERFNRTLLESLAKTAANHLNDWDKFIAPVLFAYRTNKHATTGITPFFLLYGREARLPSEPDQQEENVTIIDQIAAHMDVLPIKREQARMKIQTEQQKQRDRHDKNLPKKDSFDIGNKVLYYRAGLDKQWSGKLEPKWKGPYQITANLGHGAYRIAELNGKEFVTPVNQKYLKLYKERTSWIPYIQL